MLRLNIPPQLMWLYHTNESSRRAWNVLKEFQVYSAQCFSLILGLLDMSTNAGELPKYDWVLHFDTSYLRLKIGRC